MSGQVTLIIAFQHKYSNEVQNTIADLLYFLLILYRTGTNVFVTAEFPFLDLTASAWTVITTRQHIVLETAASSVGLHKP